MQNSTSSRRARRAARRALRATVRARARQHRLTTGCARRPRSLASHLLAAGLDRDTAAGTANGLRSVAKRLGMMPAAIGRTRRTVHGGRGRLHRVARYTRAQVLTLMAAYRPRKTAYRAARDLVLGLAA
jgi:hypothetical protein